MRKLLQLVYIFLGQRFDLRNFMLAYVVRHTLPIRIVLSQILASGWLMFCCGNLMLHQKRNEMIKTQTLRWKVKNCIWKYEMHSLLWIHSTDPCWNMLQTLKRRKKIQLIKHCQWNKFSVLPVKLACHSLN